MAQVTPSGECLRYKGPHDRMLAERKQRKLTVKFVNEFLMKTLFNLKGHF